MILSYSFINNITQCPHIYLNKINENKNDPSTLPITSSNMTKGRDTHEFVLSHLSGDKRQLLLEKLPDLPIVEKFSFDKSIELRSPFSGGHELVGFVDARNADWSKAADVKSGKKWSAGDFNKLMQWRVYAYLQPKIEKFYLINTPFVEKDWKPEDVLVFSVDISDKDRNDGREFIKRGVEIMDNIGEQELFYEGHHPFCWYPNCMYCSEPIPEYRK